MVLQQLLDCCSAAAALHSVVEGTCVAPAADAMEVAEASGQAETVTTFADEIKIARQYFSTGQARCLVIMP